MTYSCIQAGIPDDDDDIEDEHDLMDYEPSWRALLALDHGYSEPYDSECVMCGKERSLNDEGYCGSCWTVWTS